MRPTINTKKHIVQRSPQSQAGGVITEVILVDAVQNLGAGTAAGVVTVGAKVAAIYIEFWCTSDDASQGSANITLEKRSSGLTAMTFAQSIALFTYPNKNNVFYITQGVVPGNVQTPVPLIRGWFKIPKGKQRMALGDKIVLNFSGITGATECGFAVFKEQF